MRSGERYLYLSRHNVFYFRVIVHVTEKGCNVKKEYRRSLQTRSPHLARRLGRAMRWLFDERSVAGEVDIVEWEKIKAVLDEKLLQLIAEEKEKIRKHGPCTIGLESELKIATLPYLRNLLERLSREIQRGDGLQYIEVPQFVEEAVNDAFKEHDTLFESPEQYLQVCEATLQMLIALSQGRIDLNSAARSFKSGNHGNTIKNATAPQPFENKGHSLKAVIEEYCEERVKGGNWTEKTTQEYKAQYELLIEVINERPIESVGPDDARYFKKTIQRLPANRKKKPLYRDKSVNELLHMKLPDEDLLSVTKINQCLGRVSSLFTWAQKNAYVVSNPFHGLKIKKKVADAESRLPFENGDLDKLFTTPVFQAGDFKHPYYYWLPLIALYTGARIEEICQVYLSDIYEEQGLWVIRISTFEEGQKVKTSAGKRVIPIHGRLIELGLIEHVESLRKKKRERLFPELKKGRDGYSQNASKWFGRYKKKCGVTDKRKVFHSFRHTVIDYLKQRHVEEALIKALVGHKDDSITTGLYGNKYTPKSLQPIVEKLEFPIDVPKYFNLVG